MLITRRRLDKAMVSSILKKLIARGMVRREPNPADSRSWLLKLTEPGERLAIETRNKAHRLNNEFFSEIDQSTLREILKRLLNKKYDGQ